MKTVRAVVCVNGYYVRFWTAPVVVEVEDDVSEEYLTDLLNDEATRLLQEEGLDILRDDLECASEPVRYTYEEPRVLGPDETFEMLVDTVFGAYDIVNPELE